MTLPTFADLRADQLWSTPNFVGHMLAALPAVLSETEGRRLGFHPYHDPEQSTMRNIMLLVQAQCPGLPTPALDAIWLEKGLDATQEDLRAYWVSERLREKEARALELQGKGSLAALSSYIFSAKAALVNGSREEAAETHATKETHTVNSQPYVPTAPELYGYSLWRRDFTPSFDASAKGHGLSAVEKLDLHRTKWRDVSFLVILTLVKGQYPGEATPSFDRLWATKGIKATRDDLTDLWKRLKTGKETLGTTSERASSLDATMNEHDFRDIVAGEMRALQTVVLEASLETKKTLLQVSQLIADSKIASTPLDSWTDLASDRSTELSGSATSEFSVRD